MKKFTFSQDEGILRWTKLVVSLFICISPLSIVFILNPVRARGALTEELVAQQPVTTQTDAAIRASAEKLMNEALKLYNQGSAESLRAARKKWEQALVLWRQLDDKQLQAMTLLGIGRVYSDLGEKQKALQYYNQALPLLSATNDKRGEAIALNNIGQVYDDLGEKQKALLYYHQALPLRRATNDKRGEATTLSNIGRVYFDLEEKQKALLYYNQALPLFHAIGDKPGEATTLHNIGLVYSNLGEKQKALEYLNQALPLDRATDDKGGEATTLSNIGLVYSDLGEKQKALQYLNQALPLLRATVDKDGEATTLSNIAYVEGSKGNLQLALTNIEAAIAIIEDLRAELKDTNLRTSYFATKQDDYSFYIDLLMQAHQKDPNQKCTFNSKSLKITDRCDAIAFHISERSKARNLLEILSEASVDIRQGVNPELKQKEDTLSQQISALTFRLNLINRFFSTCYAKLTLRD